MTPTSIGIQWKLGEKDGGAPVTDYRISYD